MFLELTTLVSSSSATISGLAQATPVAASTGILGILKDYGGLISGIATLCGGVFVFFKLGMQIGQAQATLAEVKKGIENINPVVTRLNSCVVEVQSVLQNKYRTMVFSQATMDLYTEAHSPVVLKDEFRELLKKSGVDKQVSDKKDEIVEWLRQKNPRTGLDAQDMLIDLVFNETDEGVNQFLDTSELKSTLYLSGKTIKDYYVILAVYLFERIIPEVIKEELKKTKAK